MTEVGWHVYDTAEEMALPVATRVAKIIDEAIALRGEALVALPGGKSPQLAFERLADLLVGWDRVTVIPTDERLVRPTSPLSNYARIANYFLPTGATLVPIVLEETNDYRLAGEIANAKLADLKWPPDLVWLGIGLDGHMASIFPGPDLEEALEGAIARRALGLMPRPLPKEAPVARVTLSRTAILAGRTLLITASSAKKRAVIERALRDGALSDMPAGRILADARAPIQIYWSER